MVEEKTLPAELSQLAERQTWFSRQNAERVLAWLESERLPLYGIEASRKQPDGNWMLLLDPMLSVGDDVEPAASIQQGRDFIAQHSDADLMFEPVWPGY
jgi:hypothetical protein